MGAELGRVDLAIVGSGIVGMGAALAGLRRGLSVAIVERGAAITGATVRNFGHVGTSVHVGEAGEYARRANEVWRELAAEAGFWIRDSGTLVVAREQDELAVLAEAQVGAIIDATAVAELAPVVGALGAVVVPGDLQVDPREAGPAIARYLERRGVQFHWRTSAVGIEPEILHTSRGRLETGATIVAIGHDVDQLYPQLAEDNGVVRCGLDMLLADGVGLSIPLLTGTSMLRYSAFTTTPTAAALRDRVAAQSPELLERDVNEMYTERPDGTLLVGDTHYRGEAIAPFQEEESFDLLLGLGEARWGHPLRVRQRWQGVYASAPQDFLRAAVGDGIRVVSVTTGIGMTTGLGLAESVVAELFDPTS